MPKKIKVTKKNRAKGGSMTTIAKHVLNPENIVKSVEERREAARKEADVIAPAIIERQIAAQERSAKALDRMSDLLDDFVELMKARNKPAVAAAEPAKSPIKVTVATTADAAKAAGVKLPVSAPTVGQPRLKVIKRNVVLSAAKLMAAGGRK